MSVVKREYNCLVDQNGVKGSRQDFNFSEFICITLTVV